ncbi:MAG: sulfate ABC transporter substrate-binding protein [Patulibacter sp.]|nr:sulfate ABC transporter substrate-binding protein [Patulibacter sp.]
MRNPRRLLAPTAATLGLVLAGCGGSSDSTDGDAAASVGATNGAGAKLSLVAYAVPKVGFDKLIPAFQATEAGAGVTFAQSYGASGDQSRKVEAGLESDVVNFSVEPDVTRLVRKGIVDEDWNSEANKKGLAFGSVVTIVVRAGNPKGIQDWDDLLKDGVEVVTPNPFSSGSAKWNLLAPYAAKSDGGKDGDAGLAFVEQLVTEHVEVQPKSGREATETFLQGTGDVLLSYENEALFIASEGEAVEHVTPPVTFKIENPIAVLNTSKHPEQAQAFLDFNLSPEGQKLWAEAGFRPVDDAVAAEYADKFPVPEKLWTIDDLGGWGAVDPALFDPDDGSIAKIYDDATG